MVNRSVEYNISFIAHTYADPKPVSRATHRHHVSESLELNNNNNTNNFADIMNNIHQRQQQPTVASSSRDDNVITQGDELRRLKGSRALKTAPATANTKLL